jgi:hypothetical protein
MSPRLGILDVFARIHFVIEREDLLDVRSNDLLLELGKYRAFLSVLELIEIFDVVAIKIGVWIIFGIYPLADVQVIDLRYFKKPYSRLNNDFLDLFRGNPAVGLQQANVMHHGGGEFAKVRQGVKVEKGNEVDLVIY